MDEQFRKRAAHYWHDNLKLVASLLGVWVFMGFGCSIFLREWLDANLPTIGHAPFGFWMAQQGAIISFVVLMFVYAWAMNRLDKKHGFDRDDTGENA